ncbi:MAG: nitrous oxide reductase family maturation protein NosD [Gemmataceae bacterium]
MNTSRPLSAQSWLARAALVAGAVLLYLSPDRPYWLMKLHAPQYPKGLNVAGYPDKIAGDVAEIDGLNHYIGMKELEKAAQFERSVGRQAVYGMAAVMVLVAVFATRWSPLLLVPGVLFPAVFIADLYWWLRDYGLNLDPHAAMSSSIKPFVPTVLGIGKVGQFKTEAWLGDGHYMAMAAAAASLYFGYVRWFRWRVAATPPAAAQPATAPSLVAAAIAVALSAGPGTAATWQVRPDGPVKTIADAVRQAAPGDTIEVAGGTHPGPVVVDKAVALVGRDWPVIDGGGKGTVVTLAAPGVRFTGFVVRNTGDLLANEDGDGGVLATAPDAVIEGNRLEDVLFGISLRDSPRSVVRGNALRGKNLDIARRGDLVRLWWSHSVTVADNELEHGRDLVLWYSKGLTVRGNRVQHGRYGIHFMYCDDAVVSDNRFADNSVGAFLMYSRRVRLERNWVENNRGASGYGVGLKDMDDYVLRGNVVASNRTGVFMEGARGEMADNLIAYNERGVTIFTSCTRNRVENNSFVENGEQVTVEGRTALPAGNEWAGNFWSDYRGLDADGDGFGDQPYRPVQLFERLTDRNSGMRLFAHGPAAEAIDYSSKLFPIFEPQAKFTDPRPRMAPAPPPLSSPQPTGRGWPLVAVGLLVGAAGCLTRWPLGAVRADPDAPVPPPAAVPAVAVTGLTKRYGAVAAVDGLSFAVRPGEAVALWGANGAGKTTLLKCLLGLVPFEGTCSILGQPCGMRGKASRRLLGYVPQEVKLHPDQTVLECVRFYAALRRVGAGRGIELLAEWGLAGVHDRPVRHLSGGMRQKLALVLALLSDPPVLLLDEPTSNLDVAAREEFGRLLARLKAAGKTLLFCTHRTGEIAALADRVVVLEAGRKAAEGTPDELRGRLLKPAVLRLCVPAELREMAAETLRAAGFTVRADGGEVWVDVPAGRKAEALARLQAAGVSVLDFDVESDRGFQGD